MCSSPVPNPPASQCLSSQAPPPVYFQKIGIKISESENEGRNKAGEKTIIPSQNVVENSKFKKKLALVKK